MILKECSCKSFPETERMLSQYSCIYSQHKYNFSCLLFSMSCDYLPIIYKHLRTFCRFSTLDSVVSIIIIVSRFLLLETFLSTSEVRLNRSIAANTLLSLYPTSCSTRWNKPRTHLIVASNMSILMLLSVYFTLSKTETQNSK